MTMETRDGAWPRIGVMGAGGIGCYFAGMLARAGAPVAVVARPRHVEAIRRDGLRLDSPGFDGRLAVAASTDPATLAGAEIVLVSVKTISTREAAEQIAPHLAPNAIVISLQNGIDNAERLRAHVRNLVCPAAVYVAAEMAGPGHIRHNGGNIVRTGLEDGTAGGAGHAQAGERLAWAAATLRRAGIDCRVSENIRVDLWTKLASNCSYNAISALARATCGRIASDAAVRDIMLRAIEEVVVVARAEGVSLDLDATVAGILRTGETMMNAVASAFQDISAGRRTEIDDLNGAIVRRGQAHGIDTPVNATLYAVMKLLEESVALERQVQPATPAPAPTTSV